MKFCNLVKIQNFIKMLKVIPKKLSTFPQINIYTFVFIFIHFYLFLWITTQVIHISTPKFLSFSDFLVKFFKFIINFLINLVKNFIKIKLFF